jgi:hypothetical protein
VGSVQQRQNFMSDNYDANGNDISDMRMSWNGSSWGAVNDAMNNYSYNGYNQYVMNTYSSYDGSTFVPVENAYYWYESYQGPAGISEVPSAISSTVYPNPFNSTFTVAFDAGQSGAATLKLYNINGQLLTRTETTVRTGANNIDWDGGYKLPAGVYIYELYLGNAMSRGKVVSQ